MENRLARFKDITATDDHPIQIQGIVSSESMTVGQVKKLFTYLKQNQFKQCVINACLLLDINEADKEQQIQRFDLYTCCEDTWANERNSTFFLGCNPWDHTKRGYVDLQNGGANYASARHRGWIPPNQETAASSKRQYQTPPAQQTFAGRPRQHDVDLTHSSDSDSENIATPSIIEQLNQRIKRVEQTVAQILDTYQHQQGENSNSSSSSSSSSKGGPPAKKARGG